MSAFLTAEWNYLVMANYAVPPDILKPYLPAYTEIDFYHGVCYVSLVGFMFHDVRLKGIPVPFHRNFEEVNLRFYVKYNDRGEWKRGVVFIREIVPLPIITFVANTVYGENYKTMPMRHTWDFAGGAAHVSYEWKFRNHWNTFSVQADKMPVPMAKDSEEEFITEHFWGYARLSETVTSEYEVKHPRWNIHPVRSYDIHCRFAEVYGNDFSVLDGTRPLSVFLAEGSSISVMGGRKIHGPQKA